jgi:hypothetical protein
MVNFRNKHVAGPVALLVSMAIATAAALVWGSAATSTAATSTAAIPTAARAVAQSPDGELRSRVVGETLGGKQVTGKFVPLDFRKRNGNLLVRGLIQGVVRNDDGSVRRTFGVMRTLRVDSIGGVGTSPTTAGAERAVAAAATCDVLRLVLGPLDLDLLGLKIHLDRVVLVIEAESGPGNLLGNLLCAVAGLLDDGLDGLLDRVVQLLNRILGQLGLGL